MTDENKDTTTTEGQEATDEKEPTFAEEARKDLGLDDEQPPEATEEKQPEAKADGTSTDDKAETQDALEQHGLSEDEAKKLAQRPEVVQAVLSSDYGTKALDDIIAKAMESKEQAAAAEKEASAQRATLEEAYRKGVEDGDWSEYGQLVGEYQQKQRELESLRPAVEAEVVKGYDAAFMSAFSQEIEALSEEELDSLKRDNFRSESEWQSAVFNLVADKARNGAIAGFQGKLSELEQAAANSATAARARELATPGLPGGSASEKDANAGLSVGELVREAFADEIAELRS